MVNKVLLVAEDEATIGRMRQVLDTTDQFELAAVVAEGHSAHIAVENDDEIVLVVIDERVERGNGGTVARELGGRDPLLGLVLFSPEEGASEFAAAFDAGARALIAFATDIETVLQRLSTVWAWSEAARASTGASLIGARSNGIAVVAGAKGGVGTSTTSLLLAHSIAKQRGGVTLVDMNLASGDLAGFAGVSAQRSIADLTSIGAGATIRSIRDVSYQIRGGITLLAAPSEQEKFEDVGPELVRSILGAVRYDEDAAVFDIGSTLDETRAVLLEGAPRVVLVTTPDLPSLRAARATLRQWERLGVRAAARTDVILNRRTRNDDVNVSLAEQVLERPIVAVLPDGRRRFRRIADESSLLDGHSRVHQAVSSSVDVILGGGVVAPDSPPRGDRDVEAVDRKAVRREARAKRAEDRALQRQERVSARRERSQARRDRRISRKDEARELAQLREERRAALRADSGVDRNRAAPGNGARDLPPYRYAPGSSAPPMGWPAGEQQPLRRDRDLRGEGNPPGDSGALEEDRGQAVVEAPLFIALALMVFLIVGHALLWGTGMFFAHTIASATAREIGIHGLPDSPEARERYAEEVFELIPAYWRDGAELELAPDRVEITLSTPSIVPGVTLDATIGSAVYAEGNDKTRSGVGSDAG